MRELTYTELCERIRALEPISLADAIVLGLVRSWDEDCAGYQANSCERCRTYVDAIAVVWSQAIAWDTIRADGRVKCPGCQQAYSEHPAPPGYYNIPTIVRLCTGMLVKL